LSTCLLCLERSAAGRIWLILNLNQSDRRKTQLGCFYWITTTGSDCLWISAWEIFGGCFEWMTISPRPLSLCARGRRTVTDRKQVFISYCDFSDPLIPFAITLFIQSDLNHRKPFIRQISWVIFNRPLSIALNLKSRLVVFIQFMRVLSPFWSYFPEP
jgi:hypothetical protein